MRIKVRCNQCDHIYIEEKRPFVECPECGHGSVTFIRWLEDEDEE